MLRVITQWSESPRKYLKRIGRGFPSSRSFTTVVTLPGNNAGIRAGIDLYGKPAYVVVLNPDTVVRSDAFQTLEKFMNKNPRVGIAGASP